jgi:hypothetical protein
MKCSRNFQIRWIFSCESQYSQSNSTVDFQFRQVPFRPIPSQIETF